MANTLVSDKRFLEFEGLKALILKLGALREEYMTKIGDLNKQDAEILARLDALLKAGTNLEGRIGIVAGKEIIVSIVEYIEQVRKEMGELPVDAQGTIYDRLAAIEADCKQLNDRVLALETEAFTAVAAEYDRANNQIRVGFGTTKAAATAASGALVPNKSFTIDTSDFVVDGLLSEVHSVTVVTEGAEKGAFEFVTVKTPEGAETVNKVQVRAFEQVPMDKRVDGRRYLLFSFKVNDTDGEGTSATPAAQDIWVDLVDIHDNFKFKAAPSNDQYLNLEVTQIHNAASSTDVTYTATVGAKAAEDFKIVEGTYVADPVGAPTVMNRGVLKLDSDLAAAEASVKKLQDEVETPTTGLLDRATALEGEVRTGWTDNATGAPVQVPGLLDRAAALEEWTKKNIVSVQEISDYFDYWVMGDIKDAGDPNDPFITATNKRKEELNKVKKDFTQVPVI